MRYPPGSYAIAYARRGWLVFPCALDGKVPIVEHGCRAATADEAIIRRWWRTEPQANVAVATGAASGVFVVDVDGDNGEDTLRELEKRHGRLPETVESLTGNGRHLWFRWPEGQEIRNSAGKLGPGLDIRGEGGYVLVEPSIHPSGRPYSWEVDHHPQDVALAEAPDWLLGLLRADPARRGRPAEEWRAMAGGPILEGCRNDTIARLAGHLLRRGVDPYVVLDLMQALNLVRSEPPLPAQEVEQIVNSISGREADRRARWRGAA